MGITLTMNRNSRLARASNVVANFYERHSMIRLLLICSVFSFTIGCKTYSFDKPDLEIIDTYNKGDTLIFASAGGHIDSIQITSKEISYNGYSEGYEGNPEVCRIYYKTIPAGKKVLASFEGSQGDVCSNEFTLLSAVKYKRNEPATITLKLLGFDANLPKDYINNPTNQPIEIKHFCIDCNGVDSTDVVKISWSSKVGVIMYQKKDGTIFNLINKNSR